MSRSFTRSSHEAAPRASRKAARWAARALSKACTRRLHPGEVLKELLNEAGLTVNILALALRVPANRIGGIVKGQRGITGDTSLRLARYFGTSAQMWMNLQAKYDLAIAEDAAAARIKKEVRPRAAA